MNINDDTKLNDRQELFCRYYTRPDTETFLNGMLSYAEAYEVDLASLDTKREIDENGKEIPMTSEREKAERNLRSHASRLLSNDNVRKRKDALLVELFDSNDMADARLTQIIIKGNDANAINAIKHRNEIKQRITKKVDITSANRPLSHLTDAELEEMLKD